MKIPHPRAATLAAALTAASLLTGCGLGPAAPPSLTGAALQGHVLAGQQPLTGATIQLYAVGNTGNGSPAQPLLKNPVTTDATGSFSITSDYACPTAAPATPIYLTATGGNPGLPGNVNNTAITLVDPLGPCNTLLANAATTHLILNEATTAAAAWALSPFATSLTNIGATSTNLQGITNAFFIASQLADPSIGQSPGAAAPAGATVETAKLYSLADILASCVNSTGADKACSSLFSDVTPTSATLPSDTFAAALLVVKNPGNNVANIFTNHVGPTPPFPALASAPSDWTMSIRYSLSSTPLTGFSMGAIDSSGDLVGLSSSGNNSTTLASFNRQFTQLLNVPICPDSNGYCYAASAIDNGLALDSSGDIWVDTIDVTSSPSIFGPLVGSFSVTEFSSNGTEIPPISGEPVGASVPGSPATAQAIAADSDGAVWVASGGDSGGNVAFLNNAGTLLSPAGGYLSTSGISPVNIAIDTNHTAWIASWGYANEAGKSVSYPYITSIANPGLSSTTTSPTITKYGISAPVSYAIAVDPSNNVWFTSGSSQSAGFNTLGYIKSSGVVGATAITGGGLVNGVSMATDPGNHLWIASYNPTSYILTLSEFSTAGASLGTVLSPSTGYGLDNGVATAYIIENIPGLIIDTSGSLWLPNTYQDQPGQEYFNDQYPLITLFVGLATPTKTPLLGPPQAP